ncbi:MAG TPA: DUF502 domain-containing protein [Burkholderiaceae bacterium]|nr:DUF502 domain-containing protein [Burkholderiaceae bacterium]
MLRRYFIAGLLIWVPIAITVWVLSLIVTTMDMSLSLLPDRWHPVALFGLAIPGLGMLLTLLVILATGVLAANFVGETLLRMWESLLARIPIVRSIYSSVKQVSDTVLSPQGHAFRKAMLIEYPRKGLWTIAFQTGIPAEEVLRLASPQAMPSPIDDVLQLTEADAPRRGDMISVYVPTTPNPTSGFFLIVNRSDVRELDMSVDAALKYVVSMGVVAPGVKPRVSLVRP